MHQTDRGEYRKDKPAAKAFKRIGIVVGTLVVLLILAWLTNPTEKKMRDEMDDNIRQSIWSRDSINADGLDIFLSNVSHSFTHFSDSITNEMKNRWNRFEENNKKEYFRHTLFSTMYITCGFRGITTRCGIGIFGLVIPTVDFNQFIPPLPIYHDSIPSTSIQSPGDDEYYGTTTVDIFRWEGE